MPPTPPGQTLFAGINFRKEVTFCAEKWHGEAFRQKVKEIYGSEPEIRCFETPFVVDNVAGAIVKG